MWLTAWIYHADLELGIQIVLDRAYHTETKGRQRVTLTAISARPD